MPLLLSLLSQDRVVIETEVDEVILPTESGQIGILPHHVDLVTLIKTGEITTNHQGKVSHYAVFGGLAEITASTVTVLADRAEAVEEIDVVAAERAREAAVEMMSKSEDPDHVAYATGLLERSINRIAIAKRRKSPKHL